MHSRVSTMSSDQTEASLLVPDNIYCGSTSKVENTDTGNEALLPSDPVVSIKSYGDTPDHDSHNDGALQSGDRPDWRSKGFFGVYYQYIAVGMFLGSAKPLMYPVFNQLLDMESYQVNGAYSVMTCWWSLKVFLGALSDTTPLRGYRRKGYVLLGWSCAVILTLLTITFGQPYKGAAAWKWLLCFSGINLAYIVGDVAMDSMVTDLAQREPLAERGSIQSSIYSVRFASQAITGALVSFGFSSAEYGGTFSWGFTLPQYLTIMATVAACGILPYYWLAEQPNAVRKSYCDQFNRLYERIKLDAVWRVIVFSFLVHLFTNFSNATSYDIAKQWVGVFPWIDGLFHSVIAYTILSFGIWATQKYFNDVSWHKLLIISIGTMSVLIYIPAVLIDLAVVRNQFFFVGAPLLSQFSSSMYYITASYCAVEVAEPGYEGITYGFLTTIGNLTIPLASVFSNNLAAFFNLYDSNGVLVDDTAGRRKMVWLDTTILILNLCALPCVWILPKQKREIQELLATKAVTPRMALICVTVLVLCLCWSLLGNFMAVFPQTSCLKIVGGKGCN